MQSAVIVDAQHRERGPPKTPEEINPGRRPGWQNEGCHVWADGGSQRVGRPRARMHAAKPLQPHVADTTAARNACSTLCYTC